jgi:DNA polymerase-1
MNKQLSAVDLETTGLIDKGVVPRIICMSYHDGNNSDVITDVQLMEQYLSNVYPIFHNANFDVAVLRGHGINVPFYHDTMLLSYVQNTNQEHSLKAWGERLGLPKLEQPWDGVPTEMTEELKVYAIRDVEITWKLFHHLYGSLDSDGHSTYNLELKMGVVIQEMERVGIPIDNQDANRFKDELESEVNRLNNEIAKLITVVPTKKLKTYKKEHPELAHCFVRTDDDGWHYQITEAFNPNSRYHKAYALQTLYGWVPAKDKISKDGTPVVDADVMEDLADKYPLAQFFTEISKVNKVLNTFVRPLLELQDKRGFVHTSLNQTVTRTGRLSSSAPNLQNIPANGDMGKRMRHLVRKPSEKTIIIQADLSNIEARVFAYYLHKHCGYDSMANAFINDLDMHQANADSWGCSRQMAKKVLYLTLYGGGANKLAIDAGVPLAEAESIIKGFTDNCPVNQLKEKVWAYVRRLGYIRTLLGRHIYYPEINSKDRAERGRAERQCFNALLQGTAADIMKDLIVKAYTLVKESKAVCMLTVHDELLILSYADRADDLCKSLTELWCSQEYIKPINIKAEFKHADSWGDLH